MASIGIWGARTNKKYINLKAPEACTLNQLLTMTGGISTSAHQSGFRIFELSVDFLFGCWWVMGVTN